MRPQATVLGGNCKVDSPSAAFANGTMAHDMDMDDLHEPTALHVAAAIVPAALATAERYGNTGRSLIVSIVACGSRPSV